MIMENSYILNAFISKGYLQEYFTAEKFTIFRFLNAAYVAVLRDGTVYSNPSKVKGALLSNAEVQIIICSNSENAIEYLSSNDESSITFSEEMLCSCKRFIGRLALKKQLKKYFYYNKNAAEKIGWLPDSISKEDGYTAIKMLFNNKMAGIKVYRRDLKKVKILGAIALICIGIAMASFLSIDLLEKFNKDRVSTAFDKNSTDYAYSNLEVDTLIPFITLTNDETYFVYCNSQNKNFGILKFYSSYEQSLAMGDLQGKVVLDKPIILYGNIQDMPNEIEYVFTKKSEKNDKQDTEDITLPGHTITMPDGSEMIVPDHTISSYDIDAPFETIKVDNSNEVIEFLAQQGISLDSATVLGTKYVVATTTPEKVTSLLNKLIEVITFVLMLASMVLLIPILIFAFKADKSAALLDSDLRAYVVLEKLLDLEIVND